jgi:LacI family transcriptional regulator
VLRAPNRVRAETRQRVEAAIALLDYQPNRAAQTLKGNASRLIGYRSEPAGSESMAYAQSRLLHALTAAAQAADHQLLLFTTGQHEDEIAFCTRLHRAGLVDGFVLPGAPNPDPRPRALLDIPVPFVICGDGSHRGPDTRMDYPRLDYPRVEIDEAAGVSAAVDHLVRGGHRAIGYLGLPDRGAAYGIRAQAWCDALARHGLRGPAVALDAAESPDSGAGNRLARRLLDLPDPPTAVVAASDALAAGVLDAVRAKGLLAGRDVAVVGFGDTPLAAAREISSVRQPFDEFAAAAVAVLVARLSTRPADRPEQWSPSDPIRVPARLVARRSSGAVVD